MMHGLGSKWAETFRGHWYWKSFWVSAIRHASVIWLLMAHDNEDRHAELRTIQIRAVGLWTKSVQLSALDH